MTNWEIALALTIVGLSIVMPIYYSYQKKIEKQKIEQALKHGREVAEGEKIRVYLNQINLNNNFNEVSSKFDEKVFNNSEYADQILTSEYSNFDKKVYSKLFFFVGDSPSNIQFYLTDSLSNFLSASVYFNSRPNYDSLYPYIHYIRSDIKKIIESFDWINE